MVRVLFWFMLFLSRLYDNDDDDYILYYIPCTVVKFASSLLDSSSRLATFFMVFYHKSLFVFSRAITLMR